MMKVKSNEGLTLIALIVTIIVTFIILSITIAMGSNSLDQSVENQTISEMKIVQHAINQRHVLKQETNDPELYVGKKCRVDGVEDSEGEYYLLDSDALLNLGISSSTGNDVINERYVVNYDTGYVRNIDSSLPPLLSYNQGMDEDQPTSYKIELTR